MKKKELLKVIEAKQKIINNKQLVEFAKSINVDRFGEKIDGLENEFDILKKEIKKALEETKQAKDVITNFSCDHEVRLKQYGLFSHASNCIFCDKPIDGDNVTNWEYSSNRNKYCVILDDKYQEDDDGYYILKDGYTINQVFEIILDFLKNKNEDDEIDLIQEFKKLNLNNCEINEEKKKLENYILIINGSNKQFIDNDLYLAKKGLEIGINFVEYFYGLLNTKIELIDNTEFFESKDFKNKQSNYNDTVKFTTYNTIEELESKLNYQKEVPFKIIIDLSELYNYKIDNNTIIKESYDLKLSERFPNSHVIKIGNLSKKSLEELSAYLKTYKKDNLYAYQNKKYHYLENNEIKSHDLENTCDNIKKLLRRK